MQTDSLTPTPILLPHALTPNDYTLAGKGAQVHYASTSLSGLPLLDYRDATHDVHALGEDIRQEETEVGTLVTVTLEPDADAGSLLLTVVIPRAQVRSLGDQVPIVTQALLTRSRLPPRIPARAQLQTYELLPLRGSATLVVS